MLILDRRDDPYTPLLLPWTYQAMVHELLGIHHNRVWVKDVPDHPANLDEVVLSCTHDEFFQSSMFLNFGELGVRFRALLDAYQEKVHANKDIKSIADMQDFVERFPAFSALANNVSKHMTLLTELSRLGNGLV